MSEYDAYVFCGLPGAGKTYIKVRAADILDTTGVSSGDIVREAAYDADLTSMESDALAEFAAYRRDQDGHGWVADELISRFKTNDIGAFSEPALIDGMRHADGVAKLRDYFDSLCCVWVAAPFQQRLMRVQARSRNGEGEYTSTELEQRDTHEMQELGLSTIIDGRTIDVRIDNRTATDISADLRAIL